MQQINRSRHRHMTSFQVISLGFLSVILLGSLLLMLPIATKSGQCTSFLDALFELRCSIEKEGVLVPLMLRKNPHGDGYETRIAKANNMSEEKVRAIIEKCTDSRFLGALGEKTVNVLKVNLLDGIL